MRSYTHFIEVRWIIISIVVSTLCQREKMKRILWYCLDKMKLDLDDSKAQSCPIQPPFILTDLITDDSVCSQSISSSYINQCAHDDHIHLHLSPCLFSQTTLGLSIKSSLLHLSFYSDLQLMCVGTWKEDIHTYFVARIISSHHQQYACFVIVHFSIIRWHFLIHSSVIRVERKILHQYPYTWLRMILVMIYIHDKCQQ